MTTEPRYLRALNRLTKWRSFFAGWQLGTRPDTDPESNAVRDQRELFMILRVEMTALTRVLMEKGVIKLDEWEKAMEAEANELERDYQRRFPGIRAIDSGLEIDIAKARETYARLHFKP